MVGPGSLAGVLAVAVRSIGFVSKLLAEASRRSTRGQVEASCATGADRWQRATSRDRAAGAPVFAGVCVYRWDINIRESTVLGLVGAGGIGLHLYASINQFAWQQVLVVLVAILAIVLVSEAVSAYVRARISCSRPTPG